jgi:hypothetical protein
MPRRRSEVGNSMPPSIATATLVQLGLCLRIVTMIPPRRLNGRRPARSDLTVRCLPRGFGRVGMLLSLAHPNVLSCYAKCSREPEPVLAIRIGWGESRVASQCGCSLRSDISYLGRRHPVSRGWQPASTVTEVRNTRKRRFYCDRFGTASDEIDEGGEAFPCCVEVQE